MKNLLRRLAALEVRSDPTEAATSDIDATNEAIARVWRRLRHGHEERSTAATVRSIAEQRKRTQRAIQLTWKKRRASAPSAGDE